MRRSGYVCGSKLSITRYTYRRQLLIFFDDDPIRSDWEEAATGLDLHRRRLQAVCLDSGAVEGSCRQMIYDRRSGLEA